MDTKKQNDPEVVEAEGTSKPQVKNFKRLNLVREVIRVSTHLRAGDGCLDTHQPSHQM